MRLETAPQPDESPIVSGQAGQGTESESVYLFFGFTISVDAIDKNLRLKSEVEEIDVYTAWT